jgi:hypothetical protein
VKIPHMWRAPTHRNATKSSGDNGDDIALIIEPAVVAVTLTARGNRGVPWGFFGSLMGHAVAWRQI